MEKLKDLTSLLYENYDREALIEYYQRKVILLNEIGASKQVISNYLQIIQQLEKQEKESSMKK